ncbi:serine/threonine-protein kinase ATR-like isoform X3 [Clytia hemisphaerica]
MMQIISHGACSAIHSKCHQVIVSILKLAQEKDIVFFYKLNEEILGMYKDVITLLEHVLQFDDVTFDEPVYCNYFMSHTKDLQEQYGVAHKMVTLEAYSQCQYLINNLSLILKEVMPSFNLYLSDKSTLLCGLVSRALFLGDPFITKNTIELIGEVVHHLQSVTSYWLCQYTNIIIGLFEWAIDEENTDEELIKTLRRTLIILIKSQEKNENEKDKDETYSMQLLNKIVRMIEITTDDVVMKHLLNVLNEVLSLWPSTLHNGLLQNSFKTLLKKSCSILRVDQETCDIMKSTIGHYFVSDTDTTNDLIREGLREEMMTIVKGLLANSGSNRLNQLKSLCFIMELILQNVKDDSLADLFAEIQLGEVYQMIIQLCKHPRKIRSFKDYYPHIITLLKSLYISATVLDTAAAEEILQSCLELASIPWISTIDPPWFDLKIVTFTQDELYQMYQLVQSDTVSIQQCCLDLLLVLSINAQCHTWISHIIRNTMANSNSPPTIHQQLLKMLPEFVLTLKENGLHVVEDDLLMFVRSASPSLVERVGEVISKVICVLSKNSKIGLRNGRAVITCTSCEKGDKESGQLDSPDVFRVLKPFFLMVKQSLNKKYKLYLTQALSRLVRHVDSMDEIRSLWQPVLDLLLDPDYETRYCLSESLKDLVKGGGETLYRQAMDQISGAFVKASAANDSSVMETLILSMGNVGIMASNQFTSIVVISLFNCFVTQDKFLASLAADQIQSIARAKKMSYHSLFMASKSQLCNMTVKKVLKSLEEGKDYQTVTDEFVSIAKLFEFPDVKAYLTETATEMLPKIVENVSTHSSIILRLFAKYSSQNRREMLFNNFKYIFSYLLRTISDEKHLEKCLGYLQEEAQVELQTMLVSEYQNVLNQLILYMSVNRDQVYHGFKILVGSDDSYEGPKDFQNDEHVAMFLQPKLLGVLAFFNFVLINSPLNEKKTALKSIICLLNVLGKKYLTPVRLKVMAILKLSLKHMKDFSEICCEAWLTFTHNVEKEYLGVLISQIIPTVLPLLQYCEEPVLEIINFLIVRNRVNFRDHFKEVYFLPEHPSLRKAKQLIEEQRCRITSLKEFKLELQSAIKSMKSENEDVQKFALQRICDLLETNTTYLQETLIQNENIDVSIKELLQALMQVPKERGEQIYALVGKCFGLIGAVDVGNMDNLFDTSSDLSNPTSVYDDAKFPVEILNELCRSFVSASSTRAQDCAAFAMQETMQFYKCSSERNQPGYTLWSQFSDSMKEILAPHLRSKYRSTSNYNWSKLQLPIYGSPKGSSYKDWTSNYTSYLIHHIKNERFSKLMKPFLSGLKYDLRLSLFLMPHVIHHTLMSGNIALVNTEFKCILEQMNDATTAKKDITHLCLQTLFSVLDFLSSWYKNTEDTNEAEIITGRANIKTFLDNIPRNKMAIASLNCKSLARSLLYYEEYMNTNSEHIDNHLEFLQKIYYALDEPDGISGIAATRNRTPTLNEKIFQHRSAGNLRGAVACYERAIFIDPEEVQHHKGLLNCLVSLGQLNNASMNVAGIIESRPDWSDDLQTYQAEVSWRLGQWDKLKKTVQPSNTELKQDWSISLGKLLCSLKSKETDKFTDLLSSVRCEQTRVLLNANFGSGGYTQAYQSMLRLHMLRDMEQCSTILFNKDHITSTHNEATTRLLKEFDTRLNITEASYKTRESVLYLHQVFLQLLPDSVRENQFQALSDNVWLKIAKTARKDGLMQTAYSALLNIQNEEKEEIIVERANWYSCQKKVHEAFLCAKGETEFTAKNLSAKRILQKATLMEETESSEPGTILAVYKELPEKHPTWEKGHFFLAQYYEKLMSKVEDGSKEKYNIKQSHDFLKHIIKSYGFALQYGNKYIYQSMPRLLTHWLDFGQVAHLNITGESSSAKQSEVNYFKDWLKKVNDNIHQLVQILPPYKFLTALSQLVSRICHPSKQVWELLKAILCKIFKSYHQQAIWYTVAVYKSTVPMRSSRCKEVFQDVISSNSNLKSFIQQSLELTEMLLTISNQKCSGSKLSMRKDFPTLVRMLKNPNLSPIMVPLQRTLTVKVSNKAESKFDPFPDALPYISGVDDMVDVLSSLQKPKKIKVRASDGLLYPLMCKPKDDLRKDCRLMEFNSLVNKFLLQDSECRRRQLHIRTYAVIPLNEECGLLEWVPNTKGLRIILQDIYREKGISYRVHDLKQIYDHMTREPQKARKCEIFVKRVLPKYPPIFHEWFLSTFFSPTKWYMARLAYCRTSAVISMVGYILGLGDRHGENILFDATCGDCVHVDFNCLFNKGEKFDCPERVPFRMTHNMVKAMGALGYEGVFRKSCEHTMKVMRREKESLLSVLNTFLYDPLVEWKKDSRRAAMSAPSEKSSTEAMGILRNIDKRLRGITKHSMIRNTVLSIEGQVDHLIQDATDISNLCQMYIGWAAYL